MATKYDLNLASVLNQVNFHAVKRPASNKLDLRQPIKNKVYVPGPTLLECRINKKDGVYILNVKLPLQRRKENSVILLLRASTCTFKLNDSYIFYVSGSRHFTCCLCLVVSTDLSVIISVKKGV